MRNLACLKKSLHLFLGLLLTISSSFADAPKVALVLDKGGKDDKSFNSSAYRGANEAKEKLGIQLKVIEASEDSFFEPAMRSFASKKYDLIVAIGVAQSEVVKKLSKELPQQKFAIVDAVVDSPNVASLIFEEHEGSYLVGYAAGLKTKTGKIGFVGGMDIPLIRRFEKAYAQGAADANPKIKVQVNYVGVTSDAWNNPTKAKELAQNQYSNGVDIIYSAAGASNNGVFDSADSSKKLAIGCDSNQNWIKPGKILTSMLKRVDTAVFQTIQNLNAGQFKAGKQVFGMKNEGVDWALDEHNKPLFTEDELKKIQDVRSKIISGKIKIIDYYKTRK